MFEIHPFGKEFVESWFEFVDLVRNPDGSRSKAGEMELRLRHQSVNEEVVEIQYLLTITEPLDRHFRWPLGATEEGLRERLHRLQQRLAAAEVVLDAVEKNEVPRLPPDVAARRAAALKHKIEERYAIAVAWLDVVKKQTFLTVGELAEAAGTVVERHPISSSTLSKALAKVKLNGQPLYCKAPAGASPQRRRPALRKTIANCVAWCQAQGIVLSLLDLDQ